MHQDPIHTRTQYTLSCQRWHTNKDGILSNLLGLKIDVVLELQLAGTLIRHGCLYKPIRQFLYNKHQQVRSIKSNMTLCITAYIMSFNYQNIGCYLAYIRPSINENNATMMVQTVVSLMSVKDTAMDVNNLLRRLTYDSFCNEETQEHMRTCRLVRTI